MNLSRDTPEQQGETPEIVTISGHRESIMQKLWVITLFSLLLSYTSAQAETLTLSDCLKRAASSNHELRVAEYDTQIARENIVVGRSGYLPRLDCQGGYTVQQAPQSVKIMNFEAPTQQKDYGFFSTSLEQTIYDFGRTSARYERAKAQSDAIAYGFTARQKDVFLQVVQAYYGVLESLKLLQSADEEVVQMTDHLKVARNLFDQGVVTRNDLLQAEVQLANSRQRSLAAANNVKNSWLYLNYLTGQTPGYRADLEDNQEIAPVLSRTDAETAMANRPEITAQKKYIDAGALSVRESRSGYFPEIFARLGADYVENSMVKEQTIFSATIGLRINLFDGLATTSRFRQSVMSLSQSRESLRQLEAQVRLEYDTALNDARVSAERIATVKKSIQQGDENLRINKDRYMEQVGTATNVVDAQTLLTQTKTEYYRALFDYQVAVARVKKALGEL
jgi:TolC family type I secretion outer membrane protein